jgi:P4 family phage/plasmid primase-like protien
MTAVGGYLIKAIELSARGLHVFPCDHPDQPTCIGLHGPDTPCDGQRGKHPAVKWRTWAVTNTNPMIMDAWNRRGGLANIGVSCGPTNLVVLDEDAHGELVRWCKDQGITLPPTYEVTTGRGRHLYFHWDHGVQRIGNHEKPFAGYHINVRGDGGLVISEGSRHTSGAIYTGNGKPIVDLPQKVADLLLGRMAPAPSGNGQFFTQSLPQDPNTTMIGDGERHPKLVEYAGRLLGLGLDYYEAEPAFEKRWLLCEQPDGEIPEARFHSPTCRYPVTWDEAKVKLTSVYSLYAATGTIPPAPAGAPPPLPGQFFGKQGLRALDLTNEVMKAVVCGFGQLDERFYTYEDGVWTAGRGPIAAKVVHLLGNRYRPTHIKNVTDIIEHQPDTARITDEPLADFINVPNGMVLWRTGDIIPHNPAYCSTVQLPIEYVPGAKCPQFEKFLREVLPADLVDSGFIWELIGYTLYSGNPLHVAVLLFGKGRNGKGTLIRVLKALLGEHNISTVSLHELTENKFRVATLYQKLANLAGDLDSKWLENTALFKKITGHDGIQGEYKYGASFEFDPWALPIYSANKAFGSPDSSEGWVARWVVVPFPNSFLGREDRLLDAKLTSESELRGILAKSIAALPVLMARGNFADLPSLAEAKHAFVLASDAIRAWIDECCVLDAAAWTPRTDLYRAYAMSTGRDGGKQLGAREFYNRVEQVGGIVATMRGGTRGFRGVQIGAGLGARFFAGQTP